jgi:hypothetical protein
LGNLAKERQILTEMLSDLKHAEKLSTDFAEANTSYSAAHAANDLPSKTRLSTTCDSHRSGFASRRLKMSKGMLERFKPIAEKYCIRFPVVESLAPSPTLARRPPSPLERPSPEVDLPASGASGALTDAGGSRSGTSSSSTSRLSSGGLSHSAPSPSSPPTHLGF